MGEKENDIGKTLKESFIKQNSLIEKIDGVNDNQIQHQIQLEEIDGILNITHDSHSTSHGQVDDILMNTKRIEMIQEKIKGIQMKTKEKINDVVCSIGSSEITHPKITTCPISNPHYISISGICFYLETTELSYSQSDENCQRKGGKLYEPQSSASNTAVFTHFRRVFGLSDVRWIGIDNLTNLGYRYNSNQQNLSFDINQMWHSRDSQDVDHKCVVQDDPLWWDRSCSQTYPSLCEI